MHFELEYVDLKLDSSRPLEVFGAVVGAAIGAYVSLKFKIVFAAPAVAAIAYSVVMHHKPGTAITEEVMQIVGTNALIGATGAIVLGAKVGSYLDDVRAQGFAFAAENNMSEKSGSWYKYFANHTSTAKDAVLNNAHAQMIKILKYLFNPETEAPTPASPTPEPTPKPKAEKAPTPEPTPVKDDTIFGRMDGMREEVLNSYHQYQELYHDAWNLMFGTNSSDAH